MLGVVGLAGGGVVSSEESSDGHGFTARSHLVQFAPIVSQYVVEPRCRLGRGRLGRRRPCGFGRVCDERVKGSQTCIVDDRGSG